MASWRLARSLEKLREQANRQWPKRSKTSDGTIGDQAHSARTSKHNPNSAGVVRAWDATHDPGHGADMAVFTENLRQLKDKRLDHVIFNRRIFSSTKSPWQWRRYTGSNPHDKHAHIAVRDEARYYDDPAPWPIFGDDMPLTDADVKKILSSPVLAVPTAMASAKHPKGSKVSAGWILQAIANKISTR